MIRNKLEGLLEAETAEQRVTLQIVFAVFLADQVIDRTLIQLEGLKSKVRRLMRLMLLHLVTRDHACKLWVFFLCFRHHNRFEHGVAVYSVELSDDFFKAVVVNFFASHARQSDKIRFLLYIICNMCWLVELRTHFENFIKQYALNIVSQ